MKQPTFVIALLSVCITVFGQETDIKTVPLPYNIVRTADNYVNSRMILEEEQVYVPTSNGIYTINLNATEKGWTHQGFNGENLLECVHRENEWLAITRNRDMRLLLHSTDNGKTVEDYTPYSLFPENMYRNVIRLCQDPVNPEVVYLLSGYVGILKSTDFGKTWSVLTDMVNSNQTYCGFEIHPMNTGILLQHAESDALAPSIQISYNGGMDWINSWGYPTSDIVLPQEADYAEDCIHDVAFHPTDMNTWVYGGEGVIAKTTDGGRTWVHKGESWGYQYCTVYDNRNHDFIYSLGVNDRVAGESGLIFLISADGGETWQNAFHYVLDNPRYEDMKQTDEDLIVLGTESLFFVNKKDLQSTSALHDIHAVDNIPCYGTVYSIAGSVIKHNAVESDLSDLPKGVYIYNGNKVIIR